MCTPGLQSEICQLDSDCASDDCNDTGIPSTAGDGNMFICGKPILEPCPARYIRMSDVVESNTGKNLCVPNTNGGCTAGPQCITGNCGRILSTSAFKCTCPAIDKESPVTIPAGSEKLEKPQQSLAEKPPQGLTKKQKTKMGNLAPKKRSQGQIKAPLAKRTILARRLLAEMIRMPQGRLRPTRNRPVLTRHGCVVKGIFRRRWYILAVFRAMSSVPQRSLFLAALLITPLKSRVKLSHMRSCALRKELCVRRLSCL